MQLAFLVVHSCPLGQPGSVNTGGMNVYVRDLALNLVKLGHSIDIYTRQHPGSEPQIVNIVPGMRVIHVSDSNIEETDKQKMYQNIPQFTLNLERFCQTNNLRYDLVFSHYYISGRLGVTLQERWHVPHLTMFHTLGIVKNALKINENEPEARLSAERYVAQKCDRIIATTPREKLTLSGGLNVNPQKIAVIPCGVDLELFHTLDKKFCRQKLNLAADAQLVLFVGRVEKIKGIERLLEAIALLKDSKHLRLLIVGGDREDHSKIELMKDQTRNLGIEYLTEFHNAVPQEELLDYYNSADILVMPSFSESFGMVALEALACGTPVVANRVGAMDSIIINGKNGFLILDNTPDLLAEAINLVLVNPGKLLTATIRNSVVRYGWPRISTAISDECKQLERNFEARK